MPAEDLWRSPEKRGPRSQKKARLRASDWGVLERSTADVATARRKHNKKTTKSSTRRDKKTHTHKRK